LDRSHPLQGLECKIINSFERRSFEKREPLGHPAHTGLPREVFFQIQLLQHSEATVAVVQRDLMLLKLAVDLGIVHDAEFADMKYAKVITFCNMQEL
jgi:hypothetical protein